MTPTRSNPTRTTISMLLGFALVPLILLTRSISRNLIAAFLMAIITMPVVATCQEIFPYLHTKVVPRKRYPQPTQAEMEPKK